MSNSFVSGCSAGKSQAAAALKTVGFRNSSVTAPNPDLLNPTSQCSS